MSDTHDVSVSAFCTLHVDSATYRVNVDVVIRYLTGQIPSMVAMTGTVMGVISPPYAHIHIEPDTRESADSLLEMLTTAPQFSESFLSALDGASEISGELS